MFCKLDVRRKLIVTLALSYDDRKIVVKYFVNRAPELVCVPEMDVGPFFFTQPNPSTYGLNPTQPTMLTQGPNPTHPSHIYV